MLFLSHIYLNHFASKGRSRCEKQCLKPLLNSKHQDPLVYKIHWGCSALKTPQGHLRGKWRRQRRSSWRFAAAGDSKDHTQSQRISKNVTGTFMVCLAMLWLTWLVSKELWWHQAVESKLQSLQAALESKDQDGGWRYADFRTSLSGFGMFQDSKRNLFAPRAFQAWYLTLSWHWCNRSNCMRPMLAAGVMVLKIIEDCTSFIGQKPGDSVTFHLKKDQIAHVNSFRFPKGAFSFERCRGDCISIRGLAVLNGSFKPSWRCWSMLKLFMLIRALLTCFRLTVPPSLLWSSHTPAARLPTKKQLQNWKRKLQHGRRCIRRAHRCDICRFEHLNHEPLRH